MQNRKITKEEERLLEYLISKSSLNLPYNWKEKLIVSPMNDGGMGSLSLFLETTNIDNRIFGEQVSECCFVDADGIDVFASLYIDQDKHLFELDIWKVNNEPLIRIPNIFNICKEDKNLFCTEDESSPTN